MSTFGELKEIILGCISRVQSSFQSGGTNFANVAINNALLYTQRNWDFEWNKGVVSVACDPVGLTTKALDANGAQVKLKRIIKAFGTSEPTGHRDTEIGYYSRGAQIKDDTAIGCGTLKPRVVHEGRRVWMTPKPTEEDYTLFFYAVKMLPKLEKDSDTNFLLEYGFDYLMYRSIMELNFFIREDERFPVTAGMVRDAWQSLVNWDVSLVSPTEHELDL